jgi:sigma-B regulation protein RsbU (phosphoserine phosphatase)
MRFPARAYQLREIRCVIATALTKQACEKRDIEFIVLAINEACMNIIQHAYKDRGGEIIVEILHHDNDFLFRITDFADCVDCAGFKSRPLDELRPGGIGIHIMQQVMDEIRFSHREDGSGNILEMKKHLIRHLYKSR